VRMQWSRYAVVALKEGVCGLARPRPWYQSAEPARSRNIGFAI